MKNMKMSQGRLMQNYQLQQCIENTVMTNSVTRTALYKDWKTDITMLSDVTTSRS